MRIYKRSMSGIPAVPRVAKWDLPWIIWTASGVGTATFNAVSRNLGKASANHDAQEKTSIKISRVKAIIDVLPAFTVMFTWPTLIKGVLCASSILGMEIPHGTGDVILRSWNSRCSRRDTVPGYNVVTHLARWRVENVLNEGQPRGRRRSPREAWPRLGAQRDFCWDQGRMRNPRQESNVCRTT